MKNHLERKWIRLSARKYADEVPEKTQGVEFNVHVSPYDLPDAVRGWFDRERKRFVIEFRYLTDEHTQSRTADQHVTFHVGERSGRVYRIEADVNSLGVDKVQLRMVSAVDTFAHSVGNAAPQDNYQAVKGALSDKSDQLLAAMAG